MSSQLTYNGYTLNNVQIDRYDSEIVFAEDDITQESMRHTITGTAVITGANFAGFNAEITEARTKLTRKLPNAGTFTVAIESTNLVNITAPDERDGPVGKFSINELHGMLAAIVGFEITWHNYETFGAEEKSDVLSHRWTQRFVIDANGMSTHFVAGSLTVRANAAATDVAESDEGNNPDAYRLSVVPTLPPGHRRTRMEFATDETGNRLLYTLESQECAENLPAPATTGNGRFSWTKSLEGGGTSILGRKVFDCELTAPRGVSPAKLLAAAVNVSKNRIKYTGVSADQIMAVEVSQENIFTDNTVRFRVLARGPAGVGNNALEPGNDGANFSLADRFMSDGDSGLLPGYTDLDPYGKALVRSVRRQLTTPTSASIPKAEWQAAVSETPSVVTFPAQTYDALEADLVPAGEASISDQHEDYPLQSVSIVDEVKIETGMVLLPSQSLAGADQVFQTHKPRVMYYSESTVQRNGLPPNRYHYGQPANSIKVLDDWKVSQGDPDSNGNVVFTASYKRVLQLRDIGEAGMFATVTDSETSQSWRSFWPDNNSLRKPVDPRTNDTDPLTLNPFGTGQTFFPLGDREDYIREDFPDPPPPPDPDP